jgi:hypothetical protein
MLTFQKLTRISKNDPERGRRRLFVEIGRGAAQSQKLPLALRKPLKTLKAAMGAA